MGPRGKLTIIILLCEHNSETSLRMSKSMDRGGSAMTYLICPRTRGLFFVLFMFESNGTSKNCKNRRQDSIKYHIKQFCFDTAAFSSAGLALSLPFGGGGAGDLPPTTKMPLLLISVLITWSNTASFPKEEFSGRDKLLKCTVKDMCFHSH